VLFDASLITAMNESLMITGTKDMLHTDELWEEVTGTAVLRDLSNQPGLRQYFCVEIPLNIQLFHLDIRNGPGYEAQWSRFIFDDIRRILPLLQGNKAANVRLSVQSRRLDKGGYRILEVQKIIRGTILPGWENYAFICSDSLRYYESTADLSIGEFRSEVVVWKRAA